MEVKYTGKNPSVFLPTDVRNYLRAVLLKNNNAAIILDIPEPKKYGQFCIESAWVPKQAVSSAYSIIDESEMETKGVAGICFSGPTMTNPHNKLNTAYIAGIDKAVTLLLNKDGNATANVKIGDIIFCGVEVKSSESIPREYIEMAEADVGKFVRQWEFRDGYEPHTRVFYAEPPKILANKLSWRDVVKDGVTEEALINLCVLSKADLYRWLSGQLSEYYCDKVVAKDGYIFCQGDSGIGLSAHIDTVLGPPQDFNFDNGKISSPQGIGGDDRCGILGMLCLMAHMEKDNKKPTLFLSTDEEKGGSTTKVGSKACAKMTNGLKFIIALDRRGSNDSVYYQCGNNEFKKWINSFGFVEAKGSRTDICTLCEDWDVAGVNFSVGYYDEHTANEYVIVSQLESTVEKCKEIILDSVNKKVFKYEGVFSTTTGYSNYSYYSFFKGDHVFTKAYITNGYSKPEFSSKRIREIPPYSSFVVKEVRDAFCCVEFNKEDLWIQSCNLLLDLQK